MSVDKEKSLQAMRTFARDVARERGEPTPPSPKAEEASEPTPKKETPKPAPPVKQEPKITVPTEPKKPEPKQSPAPPAKSVEPTRIPAFHELQKEVERTNIIAEKQKEPAKSKKTVKGIEPTKHVHGGTVITDTKTSKEPFFSQVQASLTNWFTKLKKSLTPKKKNTYTVSKTERRKGVVQKATSKSGAIFSADSETLREQIKARQRAERKRLAEAAEDEDLSWSPYTEAGYLLLEGDELETTDPRMSKVEVTKKTTSAEKSTTPKPVIKSTEKIAELQEKPVEPIPELEPEPEPAPPAPEPTPEPKPTPVPEPAPPVEPAVAETETFKEDEPAANEEADNWNVRDVSLEDTNTLALLLVGVLLGIGLIGFILFGILNVFQSEEATPEPVPPSALYEAARFDSILFDTNTFNGLVGVITETTTNNEPGTLHEYRFVRSNDRPINPAALVTLMQTESDAAFANNVTDVRLVETDIGERVLLLKTPDQTLARGGMLSWEPTMYSDLVTVLALGNIPLSAGEYTDTQFGNLDIRGLLFEEETILLYTVTPNGTIIIGDTIEAFAPFIQN